MCGIIGYIGKRKAIPILIQGLERLEYRGYDSAGVACLPIAKFDRSTDGQEGSGSIHPRFCVYKERGKIAQLKSRINHGFPDAHIGIGHTRWATHGAPSKVNAHPHLGPRGQIALVHNGIVENYDELKSELKRKGSRFKSETDTEVAAHLIESYYHGDLAQAMRLAAKRIKGFFAFVAIARSEPGRICALKRSNPLVVGIGRGEHFIASDVSALLSYTKNVIYLEDNELVELKSDSIRVTRIGSRKRLKKKVSRVDWSVEEAQKGGFRHFMLKEIYEQPRVLEEILEKRAVGKNAIEFDTISAKIQSRLKHTDKIYMVSCGTAYHAGLVGDYLFEDEQLARIPAEAHVSSEFRYSAPLIGRNDAAIFITQSGETADTLAALRQAKKRGVLTIGIVNVVGSTIAREADAVIYTHAGPEIGVASTKAYLAQLMTLSLLSAYLGVLRGRLSKSQLEKFVREAKQLPRKVSEILQNQSAIDQAARALYRKGHFLYLGRGYNFPNALEGALKLKEITYAHAHGYAAGEMKHGPIALIDSEQPVVCLAPRKSRTYDKMLSNIEEIHARQGIIISIATENDQMIKRRSRFIFWIPNTLEQFSPILTAVPLQLFAYKVAVLNCRDVDQPRNLAKSVTVE